jgi:hypothetical protein
MGAGEAFGMHKYAAWDHEQKGNAGKFAFAAQQIFEIHPPFGYILLAFRLLSS